jgi:hypothetical protein
MVHGNLVITKSGQISSANVGWGPLSIHTPLDKHTALNFHTNIDYSSFKSISALGG